MPPLDSSPLPVAPPPAALPASRVLVIDDDPGICEILRLCLEENGRFTVTTELDPAIALVTAASHEPDLFIVDVQMPQLNGFEFAAAIRSDPQFALVPLIFYSGAPPEGLAAKLDAIGGNAVFVPKKTPMAELIAIAGQLCHPA